jgi:hypothetical protein
MLRSRHEPLPQALLGEHLKVTDYIPEFQMYAPYVTADFTVRSYKDVAHTGGLPGTLTGVRLLPELHLGTIVLTNQESPDALDAVTNML